MGAIKTCVALASTVLARAKRRLAAIVVRKVMATAMWQIKKKCYCRRLRVQRGNLLYIYENA